MITPDTQPTATYTQALAKGGALLVETRALLQAWQANEATAVFAERVLREDVLGRATAHRVQDIVRVFSRRYLVPSDAPARHLKRLIDSPNARQVFTDLVFFYTAQQDNLLRDFTTSRYWPAVREGRLTITNQEVRDLIWEAEQDGRIPTPWSAEIKRDMAGRVMITLTDFGLLQELKPARREVVPYRPADGTLLYVVHLLHSVGITDGSLAEHETWGLYGLEPRDVWNRLDVLGGEDWFILQRAGEVVRIAWKYGTPDEVVDVIAG